MRDGKGRFIKEEGFRITFYIPTFSKMVYWLLLMVLLLPWISIICRLDILKKILSLFDDLMNIAKEEQKETTKKNGIFS